MSSPTIDQLRKLGPALVHSPLSPASTERIRQRLADPESLNRAVFDTYGPRTEPCKIYMKRERVQGFKIGSEEFRKRAWARLDNYLGQPTNPRYDLTWDIYRFACVGYVNEKLTSLSRLTAEMDAPAEMTSENILAEICLAAFEYDVSATDVEQFYELWWLERVGNLKRFMDLCSKPDKHMEHAKLIRGLTERAERMELRVAAAEGTLDDISDKINSFLDNADKEAIQIKQQVAAEIDQTKSMINARSDALSVHFDAKHQEIETELIEFGSRIDELFNRQERNATQEELRVQRVSIREEIELRVQNLQSEMRAQIDEFKHVNDELHVRLAEIVSSELAVFEARYEKMKSNLGTAATSQMVLPTVPHELSGKRRYKISQEAEFVKAWQDELENRGAVYQFSWLCAMHRLVWANIASITDFLLADIWVDVGGWNAQTKHIVAGPSWTSVEDWNSAAMHLLDSSSELRILFIHNYDAGLVDGYLVPVLLSLRLNESKYSNRKVFLIPSEQASLQASVLEHSGYLLSYHAQNRLKLRTDVVEPRTLKPEAILKAVDGSKVFGKTTANVDVEFDLRPIEAQFNFRFPFWLLKSFKGALKMCAVCFDDRSAAGISLYHQILPWTNARYGDATADELRAFLQQLPNVVY
jgi:hypothetical protein